MVSICVAATIRTCAKFSKWGIVWHNVTNALFLYFCVMDMTRLFLFFSLSLSFSPYHLAVCVIPCCLWKLTPTVKQKKMIVSVSVSSPLSMCRIFESDFARQSFWNRFMTNVYFPRFLQVCQKKAEYILLLHFAFYILFP